MASDNTDLTKTRYSHTKKHDALCLFRYQFLAPHVTLSTKGSSGSSGPESGYLGPSPDSQSRILSLPLWVSQRGAVSPLLPTLNKAPRPYIGNPALASPKEVPCLARYSPDWPRRWSMPSRFGLVPEPLPRLWPHSEVPDEPMESIFQTLSDADWGKRRLLCGL